MQKPPVLPPFDGRFDTRSLLAWYHAHRREMPWREQPSPYRVWISEIMLQQTRVDTVIPYFKRFTAQFPDINALADAELETVLKAWEGLGYYSRAKQLHKCANVVVHDHHGQLPQTAAELEKLPGIGPYASAAIASISFGEAAPAVDGNVLRVTSRLWAFDADILKMTTRKAVFARLQPIISASGNPSSFNQAMMELGASLCTPKNAACPTCPLSLHCVAKATGVVDELPVKKTKKPIPEYLVAVALIKNGDQLLVQRRGMDGMLPGLWEFPGGKVPEGRSIENTLRNKVLEQNGIGIKVGPIIQEHTQTYSHFRIHVLVHACELVKGTATAGDGLTECRWIPPEEAEKLAFGLTSRKICEMLTS